MSKKLVPLAKPEAVGLGIGRRTVGRRIKQDPDFPRVIVINGRNYVEEDALAAYKEKLIERGLGARPRDLPTSSSGKAA
jgi:hypothetical protein